MTSHNRLVENYGQPFLEKSVWPDHHDPHRCGDAPFVPVVDAPRQHSCGSYAAGFDEKGCNKYRPNYPDDLWLETNGCKGWADCMDGVPPKGDMGMEGTYITDPNGRRDRSCWPADGFVPPLRKAHDCAAVVPYAGAVEKFAAGSGSIRSLLLMALIIAVAWFGCGGAKK